MVTITSVGRRWRLRRKEELDIIQHHGNIELVHQCRFQAMDLQKDEGSCKCPTLDPFVLIQPLNITKDGLGYMLAMPVAVPLMVEHMNAYLKQVLWTLLPQQSVFFSAFGALSPKSIITKILFLQHISKRLWPNLHTNYNEQIYPLNKILNCPMGLRDMLTLPTDNKYAFTFWRDIKSTFLICFHAIPSYS